MAIELSPCLSRPPQYPGCHGRAGPAAYGGKGWSQTLGLRHGTLVIRSITAYTTSEGALQGLSGRVRHEGGADEGR